MKLLNVITLIAACLAASTSPACRRAPLAGPPDLRLGKVECAGCGMIISEDRCSCALLVERGTERSHLCFDDIGCMLDYEGGHHDETIIERYVHDFAARGWIAAGDACFLAGDRFGLRTPMSSGVVAFEDRAAAEDQRARTGGEIKTYAELLARGEQR